MPLLGEGHWTLTGSPGHRALAWGSRRACPRRARRCQTSGACEVLPDARGLQLACRPICPFPAFARRARAIRAQAPAHSLRCRAGQSREYSQGAGLHEGVAHPWYRGQHGSLYTRHLKDRPDFAAKASGPPASGRGSFPVSVSTRIASMPLAVAHRVAEQTISCVRLMKGYQPPAVRYSRPASPSPTTPTRPDDGARSMTPTTAPSPVTPPERRRQSLQRWKPKTLPYFSSSARAHATPSRQCSTRNAKSWRTGGNSVWAPASPSNLLPETEAICSYRGSARTDRIGTRRCAALPVSLLSGKETHSSSARSAGASSAM